MLEVIGTALVSGGMSAAIVIFLACMVVLRRVSESFD